MGPKSSINLHVPPRFVNKPVLKMPAKAGVHVPSKQKTTAVDAVTLGNPTGELIEPAPEVPVVTDSERSILRIPLAKIEGLSRNVDAKNVATLIESFREAGQTAAIARKLGWDQIYAIVLDRDERGLRLVEIAENLHRRELTVLERARLVDAWTKLIHQAAAKT
jgi:hypothetical protein